MPLNINIAIVSTIKTLEKDLESIRETLAKFPEIQANVVSTPIMRVASPVMGNPMRSPEENKLRDEYRNSHPLGKGFRMTHFLTHKYKGDALRALQGWKAGDWTLSQAGSGESQAGENDETEGGSEY